MVPGYHFGLILEVFLRYFRNNFGGVCIDVGGMFDSVWEVFSTYIKDMFLRICVISGRYFGDIRHLFESLLEISRRRGI